MQVFLLNLFGGEGIDGFGDALQAEDVHQGCIGSRENLDSHRIDDVREVQSAEAVGQRKAHDLGLAELFDGLVDAFRTCHRAVFV